MKDRSKEDEWNITAVLAYVDDYPGCAALRASLREVRSDRASPGTELLAHFSNGRVVAGAMFRPSFLLENCYDVSWVFVEKAHRGLGIGAHIMRQVIERIDVHLLRGERGSILIQVLDHNVPFYEKFGFLPGARLHDGLTMVRIANPMGPVPASSSKHVAAGS